MKLNKKKFDKSLFVFYLSLIILPAIQFIIFYIIVNANSLALSFKNYYYDDANNLVTEFVGFKNIANVYKSLFTDAQFITTIKNSFLFYVMSLVFGAAVSLFFSYYIYKKRLFAGFYKVILYMPHIVSTMVITIMYKFFCEYGIPSIVETLTGKVVGGFSASLDTEFAYLLFFVAFLGCGANMLIYTSTMASVSDSVIEAAEVDGVNYIQEFWYIVLPSIFPTFSLFLVTGLLTIFTGQGNLFNIYGLGAPEEFHTLGYYLFVQVRRAVESNSYIDYPYLAAFGLALTFIAIPLIFGLKWLLQKYGPKAD